MAIVKEWTCMAHGAFDGPDQKCPHGCGASMVQRAFRTAPAIQSSGYRTINTTMQALAAEHGLSDIRNRAAVQDGTGMRRADAATYQRLNQATELVMSASRSGMQGMDAGSFFKPLNQFQPGSTGDGGALRRDSAAGTVAAGGIPLTAPRAQLVAAPHDGSNAGVAE